MGWVQHFNDSDWEVGSGISWDTDHWVCNNSSVTTYIHELGTWNVGYRPTKLRVTWTGDPSTIELKLRDIGADYPVDIASYVSGTEVNIDWVVNNLYYMYFNKLSGDDVSITNIEFLEGSSSSSSSLSSSSRSSSSSSRSSSSSSRSSSSRSSSSSSRSSSSSSSSLSSSSSSSNSSSSSSTSYTPFSQDIKMEVTIVKSSHIWGHVRDWRGHIVRKICKIVISSLDGTDIYSITESNPVDGAFNARINISTGSSVLLTCFYEGTFRGQYNLAGSVILVTGSSSSFSSSSSSSKSSSSSSSSRSSSSSSSSLSSSSSSSSLSSSSSSSSKSSSSSSSSRSSSSSSSRSSSSSSSSRSSSSFSLSKSSSSSSSLSSSSSSSSKSSSSSSSLSSSSSSSSKSSSSSSSSRSSSSSSSKSSSSSSSSRSSSSSSSSRSSSSSSSLSSSSSSSSKFSSSSSSSTDLCLGFTLLQGNDTDKSQCTASSEYSVDYPATEAWDGIADGSTTNSWISGNNCANPDGTCWLQWNFGTARDIRCMRFHTRGNAGSDAWPSNIKILGSATGAFGGEEATLYDDDVPGASGLTPDEWTDWMNFTAHASYQYLRIEIHERYVYDSGSTWVAVQEVEFRYDAG